MNHPQRRRERQSLASLFAAATVAVVLGAPVNASAQASTPTTQVTCASSAGGRTICPANTSAGAVLVESSGSGPCLLGKTWGYDEAGVWVKDGCSGAFAVALAGPAGQAKPVATPAPPVAVERSSYSIFDASGTGFLVGKTDHGELRIGGYALVRYINQRPEDQEFTDHLGNVRQIDTRKDLQFHRAMLHARGWLMSPKFRYQITSWTVMSTDQTTLYGFIGYQFGKKFNLYGGTVGIGGSRSLYGSHPYWLANDRVMADEFFRGGFSNGLWVNGEVLPGLWYQGTVANNLSQLGITAKQLDRGMASGGSLWWMPTTHEFGPNGAYGDWEYHENLATRFGMTTARSRESQQQLDDNRPENTQTKLADSVSLFETGALAKDVAVTAADVRLLSFDAALKYRGIFVQAELFNRWIDGFEASGALPVSQIVDRGFYVQSAFFPIKQKLEVYGATSWVYGDKDAGYGTSHEYLAGANAYWFSNRNIRSNIQVMSVHRSPASSTFGFYVGGQKGPTVSMATSLLF